MGTQRCGKVEIREEMQSQMEWWEGRGGACGVCMVFSEIVGAFKMKLCSRGESETVQQMMGVEFLFERGF